MVSFPQISNHRAKRRLCWELKCGWSALSFALFFSWLAPCVVLAEEERTIGLVASLTGVAANYGRSVVEGAELAIAELNAAQRSYRLVLKVEDDRSDPKSTVTGYQKLRSVDQVRGLIGGTWWANSIASVVEQHRIPFISCQTLYSEEFVKAENYFTIAGDLSDWIRVFKPVVEQHGFRSVSMVRFTSGFADTLERELRLLFAGERVFNPALVYSAIDFPDAASFVLKLRTQQADVVYFDGQPTSLSTFLRKSQEARLPLRAVFTNEIFDDLLRQNSSKLDSLAFPVFYTRRPPFAADFAKVFRARFSKEPYLQADLGYLAVLVLDEALKSTNPVDRLRESDLTVLGRSITFDDRNVFTATKQEVWEYQAGSLKKF